jgi:cytochrome c oxidase subunit 2
VRRAVFVFLGACWTGDVPAPVPLVVPPPPVHAKRHKPVEVTSGDPVRGRDLSVRKGCVNCHTIDGKPRIGPTWRGIWGTTVLTSDGRSVRVDDGYVRRSILFPQADVVASYPPVMPSFRGHLNDEELDDLVAFIISLK